MEKSESKKIFNDNFRVIGLIMDIFKANEVKTNEAKSALQFVIDHIDKCSVVVDNNIDMTL